MYHQHYITLDLLDFDQNLDQSAVRNLSQRKSKHTRGGRAIWAFSEFEAEISVDTPLSLHAEGQTDFLVTGSEIWASYYH